MKTLLRSFVAVTFACTVVAVLVARTTADDLEDLIEDGETIIEEGSEGLTTLAELYGANNTDGETCTGPNINCASGPSPDCDTGDCNAITSITIPSCEENTAFIGEYHCYQNGMECENGSCPDGFPCFNSADGGCTTHWWWF